MTAGLQGSLKFFQQFLLFRPQADGSFHHDAAEQVSGAAASNRADPFLPDAEYPSRLGFAGDLQDHLAVERRHLDGSAQRRRGEADGYLAGQMAAVTFEDGVFAHPDLHIQIPGRTTVAARLALAGQTNTIAGIDSRGDLHGQRLILANAALPVAGVAWIGNDLAAAFAARAGLLDGEYRLLHPHLTLAAAGIAGLRC